MLHAWASTQPSSTTRRQKAQPSQTRRLGRRNLHHPSTFGRYTALFPSLLVLSFLVVFSSYCLTRLHRMSILRHQPSTKSLLPAESEVETDQPMQERQTNPTTRKSSPPTTNTNNNNILYGHVHIHKTGGTFLNYFLAHTYRNICGNKGWSFDAYQRNIIFEKQRKASDVNNTSNSTSIAHATAAIVTYSDTYSRQQMDTWGFEECDYVSSENGLDFWTRRFGSASQWPSNVPLQLHVPCRDPVDHLLSQCNHRLPTGVDSSLYWPRLFFECTGGKLTMDTADITSPTSASVPSNETIRMLEEVMDSCMFAGVIRRELNDDFVQQFRAGVKCFDYERLRDGDYLDFLDTVLVPRRIPIVNYTPRLSNRPRNVDREACIWRNASVQQQLRSYMIEHYSYYAYCDRCLGSADDLFHGGNEE